MTEDLKRSACDVIDKEADVLNDLSHKIWAFKEISLEERQSHATLTQFLEERGFHVERSLVMETAFLATWTSPSQPTGQAPSAGPHVLYICEYDALPGIGHACGHNLIAEVGVGAALGVKAVLEANPKVMGKISVLGTPAEEAGGGKITLVKAGLLQGVDVAMMVHPAPFSDARPIFLGTRMLTITYQGKESHAAGYPWEGVNALDAVVQGYVGVSTLRQQIKPSCRIHVIITKGGHRTNIIPCEAQAQVQIRAEKDSDLDDLETKVRRCFQAAADATGCTVTIEESSTAYECLVTNETLAKLYETNAARVGFHLPDPYPKKILGSTDMGNVSHVVPGLHPTYNCSTTAVNHTVEFAQAAGSPQAQESTLAQAKILACVGLDIFLEPAFLESIKKDFQEDMKQL